MIFIFLFFIFYLHTFSLQESQEDGRCHATTFAAISFMYCFTFTLYCTVIVARINYLSIFSPIAFIAGLDRIFRRHDVHTAGVTVGSGDSSMKMSKFEYADDAALVDDDAATATTRVTATAAGSLNDAAMVISEKKSKAMHIHRTTRVSGTKEEEVVAL